MRALRVEGTPLHRVPDYWAIGGRFEYDWPTLNRQYDYIILAGNDPVAASYLSSHARELRRVGEITLYETVGGARLTASRTSGQDRPDAVAR